MIVHMQGEGMSLSDEMDFKNPAFMQFASKFV
jgi:hypothetical protein